MKRNLVIVFVILAVFALGCNKLKELNKGGSAAFKNEADNFSIQFPSGSSDVKEEPADLKYSSNARTYGKMFENRSDNYRSYEVQVLDMDAASTSGKEQREILEIALNGWEDEPETVVKDINVNGQKGIDSVRSIEIGPAKMTFREVVFWSDKAKKLYVVKVSAVKKENVATKEADDFVHSFKLSA